ncbi:translesion error-prone DNA polymerase V subunit UmuC [Ignatzschineria sp. LJL83]
MSQYFALIDCNNFFASCERIFRPDLKGRAIVVLSNNDGCVIARSAESKALGVRMGDPFFKIKGFLEQNNVEVFSSNYTLYGDISSRVMRTIGSIVPKIEVYSIDEAFVDFSGMNPKQMEGLAKEIRRKVKQDIGIDVCVGYSTTKTLAKLANYAAKKYPKTGGVVDLTDKERQTRLLSITPVNEVWGVGRRLTKRLNQQGINTAYDLSSSDPAIMARSYSVVLERTIQELNGISCQDLIFEDPTRQQIVFSRGFSKEITSLEEMRQAVSSYAENASERLRAHGLSVKNITVFTNTNRFKNPGVYYNEASCQLDVSTNDTRQIVRNALSCLESIWVEGHKYVKTGIILRELSDGVEQDDLFAESQTEASLKLMGVIDQINKRYGHVINLAAQGKDKDWSMKREKLSPSYTTKWADILRVD